MIKKVLKAEIYYVSIVTKLFNLTKQMIPSLSSSV